MTNAQTEILISYIRDIAMSTMAIAMHCMKPARDPAENAVATLERVLEYQPKVEGEGFTMTVDSCAECGRCGGNEEQTIPAQDFTQLLEHVAIQESIKAELEHAVEMLSTKVAALEAEKSELLAQQQDSARRQAEVEDFARRIFTR